MTSDNQKSVNQLVHEVVDLVATATNAVAIAHAEARSAEALAAAMDGGSASLGARARRIAMATCAARINSESAQDALQRLERHLAQTVSDPKQANDGWIEWSGGECPVPRETIVEVRYRDGSGLAEWHRGSFDDTLCLTAAGRERADIEAAKAEGRS